MRTAHIGLGANLEDRASALAAALRLLDSAPGVSVDRVSPVYETEPVGFEGPPFLNAVARIRTRLGAGDLMGLLLRIEERLGRTRSGPDPASRRIDLDILLLGELRVATETVTIPHPAMRDRLFVLLPLADLEPDLVPPGWDRSVRQELDRVRRTDPGQRAVRIGELEEL